MKLGAFATGPAGSYAAPMRGRVDRLIDFLWGWLVSAVLSSLAIWIIDFAHPFIAPLWSSAASKTATAITLGIYAGFLLAVARALWANRLPLAPSGRQWLAEYAAEAQLLGASPVKFSEAGTALSKFEKWEQETWLGITEKVSVSAAVEFRSRLQRLKDQDPLIDHRLSGVVLEAEISKKAMRWWRWSGMILSDLQRESEGKPPRPA